MDCATRFSNGVRGRTIDVILGTTHRQSILFVILTPKSSEREFICVAAGSTIGLPSIERARAQRHCCRS